MSSKSTVILSDDNEHFYTDCSYYIEKKNGTIGYGIVLEFEKSNITLINEKDDVVIVLDTYSDLWEKLHSLFFAPHMLNKALTYIKNNCPNKEIESEIKKTIAEIDSD
jgi:hypothetical protein